MEKVRSGYSTFSFNKNSQNYDVYMEKKALLEQSIADFRKKIQKEEYSKEIFSTGIKLKTKSAVTTLTACAYKGEVFIGIVKDSKENEFKSQFSFDEKSNLLATIESSKINLLFTRLQNDINAWEKTGTSLNFFGNKNPWVELQPVMDKIVDSEKAFRALPEKTQEIISNTGEHEKEIESIIQRGLEDIYKDHTKTLEQKNKESEKPVFGNLTSRLSNATIEAKKTNESRTDTPVFAKEQRNNEER